MSITKSLSAIAASGALAFTGITPAAAAPVSVPTTVTTPMDLSTLAWDSEGQKVQRYGSYRGYRGYGRYGRYRHRNRVDAGDVLAGVLIIGGIAAIASAASKDSRDRRYEDRDTRDNRDYNRNDRYERRDDNRSSSDSTGGMDQAINVCSDAAERQAGRDARVEEIRAVARDGDGWRVEGDLSGVSESSFTCGSTNGRVDFVQLGDGQLAMRY